MEIELIISILALIIAIAAFLLKTRTKVVVEYREDLKLSTEERIRGIESNVKLLNKVVDNYDLKPKI